MSDVSYFSCHADLAAGVDRLAAMDARFAPVIARSGIPRLRRMSRSYDGLARIVIDQQISRSASRSIYVRLRSLCAGSVTPRKVLRLDERDLRIAGLSGGKIRTLRALADGFVSGYVRVKDLSSMSDSAVHNILTSIHGIGPWTANIYLLCSLCRSDIWPSNDLALQNGARSLFSLSARPSVSEMNEMARHWSPLRAVAARLLWDHYKTMKGKAVL